MNTTKQEATQPERPGFPNYINKQADRKFDNDTCDWELFLRYFTTLRKDTVRLRESVTQLEDQTFAMENLSPAHRECILRICEVIRKKHDELLYSEKLMKEVILQLSPDATI